MADTTLAVTSGPVTLTTEAFGDPAAPALVLVMGATASMLWWPQSFCTALAARGFHVIRYDHRDTGQSTTVAPGAAAYAVEDMADDLLAVMDGYNLRRAHIAGMSLGGLIAQMVAVRTPERVHSLTLIAAQPLGWDGPSLPGMSDAVMAHFGTMASLDWSDAVAVEDFMAGIARLCAGNGFDHDSARERQRIRAEVARAKGSLASAFNHAMLDVREDWTGACRRISAPTLILAGADDPVVPPANAQALAAAIPGATLTLIDGLGHDLPEGAIPLLTRAIADFLSSVDRSQP